MPDDPKPFSFKKHALRKARLDAFEKNLGSITDMLRRHPEGNFIARRMVDFLLEKGKNVKVREFRREMDRVLIEASERIAMGPDKPPIPPRGPRRPAA